MKILFTGDLVINKPYPDSHIDKEIKNLFSNSDYNIVNLEAPVTESTSKILKTGPHLKSDKKSTIDILKNLNINLCTLANNHVLDYGEQGVLTPDNIIISDIEHIVIDLERCEKLPLFYDVVNLLYTIDIMSQNNDFIDSYFRGKYDSLLMKVIQQKKIEETDRGLVFVIVLFLKSIITWDAKKKFNDTALMKQRWGTIQNKVS